MRHNFAVASFMAIFGLAALFLTASPVRAESNVLDTFGDPVQLGGPTTHFYMFIKAGEHVEYTFTKTSDPWTGDATATLSGPGGYTNNSCTIAQAAPLNTTCTFTAPVATEDRIWKLDWVAAVGSDTVAWNVTVFNGSTAVPGRVWTDVFRIFQTSAAAGARANLSHYFVRDDGYQYRVTYPQYNGIYSNFSASFTGVNAQGTCESAYRSIYSPNQATNPQNENINFDYDNNGSCGASYKLFFTAPAADLPASAQQWDNTFDWVQTAVATTSITNLSFTYDGNPSQLSGSFGFTLDNYRGAAHVLVDANDNGSFNDPEDRRINFVVTSNGQKTIAFDGLDGNNNPIGLNRALPYKVVADKAGEIHLMNIDVEAREGGIIVNRLTGSAGNRNTLFWDDTNLVSARCSITPVLDGTAGINSAPGVHNWDIGCGNGTAPDDDSQPLATNSSWGDRRIIEDWTWDLAASVESAVFTASPVLNLTKSVEKSVYAIGDTVVFNLTVNNSGQIPTYGTYTIVDTLPAELDPIGDELPNGCSANGKVVTCVLSNQIPVNQSHTITLKTKAIGSNTGVTNVALVHGGGDETCTNESTVIDRCRSNATLDTVPTAPNTGLAGFVQNPLSLAFLGLSSGYILIRRRQLLGK